MPETATSGRSVFYRQFYRQDLPELIPSDSDNLSDRSHQAPSLEQIRRQTRELDSYRPIIPEKAKLHEPNLGFRPTVHTEIKVGTPQPEPGWPESVEKPKGIEVRVKRDVTMINELRHVEMAPR